MSKFLMIMGIIYLVSIIVAIIWFGLFFIIDYFQEKEKKKLNIERIIDEEIREE